MDQVGSAALHLRSSGSTYWNQITGPVELIILHHQTSYSKADLYQFMSGLYFSQKKKKNGQVPRFQDFNQDKLAEVQ